MSKVEAFLTKEQEEQIVEAIRVAELETSGEIRVHIEMHTELEVVDRAHEVFHWLKMDTTEQRNGVLIYIAVDDRSFAIYGDKGINEVVPDNFWEETRNIMLTYFKKNDFTAGLIKGITLAGIQLQSYFPWDHGDINELPNEISIG